MQSYAQNIFLGIPIEWYSRILGVGVLIILACVIIHIIGYIFSRTIRVHTHNIAYFTYLKIIGIFALLSTIFAMIYQLGYLLTVCELCWWQRIFMFPIEFIVLSALVYRSRGHELSIGLLAAFGAFFAGYHYWLHFQSWVMKNDVVGLGFTNCSQGGILPSCTDPTGVVEFGFLTIPFMALTIFILILWLCFLAAKSRKHAKI